MVGMALMRRRVGRTGLLVVSLSCGAGLAASAVGSRTMGSIAVKDVARITLPPES